MAARESHKAQQHHQKRLAVPYPWTQQDLAAAPQEPGVFKEKEEVDCFYIVGPQNILIG